MKRLFAAAAALTLGLSPVQLSAQSNQILKTFTNEDLEQVFSEIGATFEDASDTGTINVTFASSLRANAAIMVCDNEETLKNCYGTSILAIFDAEPGTSAEQIAKAITDYNYYQNFGRAYIDPDGDISVRMYIISDGGITRENYRLQIQLWALSLEDFSTYLYREQEQTVRKKGSA